MRLVAYWETSAELQNRWAQGIFLHLLEEIQPSSLWVLPLQFQKAEVEFRMEISPIFFLCMLYILSKCCLLWWDWRHKVSKMSSRSSLIYLFFFLQALSSFIPLPFSTNKCFLTSYPVPGTLPAFGDTGHSKCLLWEELSLLGLRHAFYGKEVIDLTSLKGVHSVPSTDWRHNGG